MHQCVTAQCLHNEEVPLSVEVHLNGLQPGTTIYSARILPPYPGLQSLRIRVYPYHQGLTHPLEMGAMIWL